MAQMTQQVIKQTKTRIQNTEKDKEYRKPLTHYDETRTAAERAACYQQAGVQSAPLGLSGPRSPTSGEPNQPPRTQVRRAGDEGENNRCTFIGC